MPTTLALKVKEESPLSRRVARLLREVEVDQSFLEELFLLLLSRRSKATKKDIEEIAQFLEEEMI